jgi:hypothetical protein
MTPLPMAATADTMRVNGVFDGAQTGIDRWITCQAC